MIGTCVSHYRLVALLSEGGMGAVYEAEDLVLGRRVAIKVIRAPGRDAAGAAEQFMREAQAVSRIEHPNVVTIHEVFLEDGVHYLVLQLVDGVSLRTRLGEGPLSVAEALRVARDVASGLEEAHRHGVVHRDVKPDNVMVTRSGACKVLDFGVAHLADRTTLHGAGSMIGTVPYMAPEQVRGDAVDARTDVYGLGVTLYEMLTGRLPFAGRETAQLVYEVLNTTPPPLRELRPDLPEALERVVAQAMARRREDRYASVAELMHDLEIVRGRLSEDVRTATSRLLARRRRRWRRAAVLVSLAALAGTALAVAVALRGPGPARRAPRVMVANWEAAVPDSGLLWLESGVADYLIRALAGCEGLRVISRETARSAILASSPRGASPSRGDVARAARALGARYLVSGTLQAMTGRIRIVCDLTNMRQGTLMRSWTEEVPRSEAGFYPAMESFSSAIAAELDVPRARPERGPRTVGEALTPSMEALRHYHEALQAGETGDVPAEIAELRQATVADSGFADAQLLLARTSRDGAERRRAMSAALAARGRASPGTRALIEAEDLVWRERIAEAASAYESIVARDPENVVAGTALAQLYIRQRRFQDAAAQFAALHDVNPYDYSFYDSWALAWREIRRDDRALAVLAEWRRRLPGEQAPLRSLAQTHQVLGDYDRALAYCDTLDQLAPGAATGLRGTLLADLGRMREARRQFERLQASPDPYMAATRGASYLAVLAYWERDYERGLRLMEAPLRRDPGTYNWWLAGLLAAGAKRLPLARAYADSIAAHLEAPRDAAAAEAYASRRFLYHLEGRIALAQDSVRLAVVKMEQALRNTSRGDGPMFRTDLARALLAAGDPARAAHELERMLELNPRYPAGLLELGRAYLRLGRVQEARRTLLTLDKLWARADEDYVPHQELHALLRASETRPPRGG